MVRKLQLWISGFYEFSQFWGQKKIVLDFKYCETVTLKVGCYLVVYPPLLLVVCVFCQYDCHGLKAHFSAFWPKTLKLVSSHGTVFLFRAAADSDFNSYFEKLKKFWILREIKYGSSAHAITLKNNFSMSLECQKGCF